jgi:gamma-glutamylcyclotransferase
VSSETYIFAYGSNLDIDRMRRRIASTRIVGLSRLPEHDLRFHVRGTIDGTAKADAYFTGDTAHHVLGMVYGIHPNDLPVLDRIEGGYSRTLHPVAPEIVPARSGPGPVAYGSGSPRADAAPEIPFPAKAWSYHGRPENLAGDLLPYDWYLDHVVRGARFHSVPADYMKRLEGIDVVPSNAPSALTEPEPAE